MADPAGFADDAWPGRRAGLWLTVTGTALMVVGALAATSATMVITGDGMSSTEPGVQQINEVALWIANLMTRASLIGGVLMGLGITLFVTWEAILTGITNRMHRLQARDQAPPALGADRSSDPAAWSDEVTAPEELP